MDHASEQITALRLSGRSGDRLRVFVDGVELCKIDALRAHELDLRVGRDLTPEQRQDLLIAGEQTRASDLALRWIAAHSRTRVEIERRLGARGIAGDIAQQTSERLVAAGLIDDRRHARAMIDTLRRRGAGKRLLEHKLRSAGIDNAIARAEIERALEGVDLADEALECARSRVRALRGRGGARTIARRTSAHLARRGYDPHTCHDAVRRALGEADLEPDV